MFNDFEEKYSPKTLNDIIFGNPESKLRIYDIVTGSESLPSSGKSAILLYGTWGTGKTTMATMLPNAIEQGKTSEDLSLPEEMIASARPSLTCSIATRIEESFLRRNATSIGSSIKTTSLAGII